MRPSPHSTLKSEIEAQIANMGIREESKLLFEKAFQILLNIDQRLERLEENMHHVMAGDKQVLESYDWVHGDLSAGGLSFVSEAKKDVKVEQTVLLDMLLPSLPEQRIVTAAKVIYADDAGKIGLEFSAIHEDDKEFIHRYVISREREMLRNRAVAREQSKTEKPK